MTGDYVFRCCWLTCSLNVRSTCLIVLVNTVLLISCLLSINYWERSFKFFNYNWVCIYIYFFPFCLISLCFRYFEALLGACTQRIVMSFWWIDHVVMMQGLPLTWAIFLFFFCLKSTSSDINATTSASFWVALPWHISFSTLSLRNSLCFRIFQVGFWDFPGGPLVKTLPSKVGLIPGWGAEIPCTFRPNTHTYTKQEQYCNKLNKD